MTPSVVASLDQIQRQYEPTTWHVPLDLSRHRRRLQALLESGAGGPYDETFRYPDPPLNAYLSDLRVVQSQLTSIADPDLRSLVAEHLDGLGRRASSRADDETFAEVSRQLDGLPSDPLVADAYRTLTDTSPSHDEARTVTAENLSGLTRRALDAYELDRWTVELEPNMAANMSVNGPLGRLSIRADATFTARGADRLVVHEVGGHVLRFENSRRQPEPLAGVPLGRSVATEEGLALALEGRARLIDPDILRTYAARTVAVHLGERLGLADLARQLSTHVGVEAAVTIALRVKRGLVRPESCGGTTKDYGYLHGMRALADVDRATFAVLQTTKWSMDHLAVMRELHRRGRLQPPAIVADPRRLLGSPSD